MTWTFKEGLPIYTQLMDQIKMHIARGDFEPGAQIPPVRELALEAGVNPNTMQRALAELERQELLYSVRTSGRFITEDEGKLNELKKSLSSGFIEDLFINLKKLGMSDDEIVIAVQQWTKGE